MTANQFRKLTLTLPEAVEGKHMNHPDFRVGGKIFATIGPDETWGMVKLSQEEQAHLTKVEPGIFKPFDGAWGRQGYTRVWLKPAKKKCVGPALRAAWLNTAPKRLAKCLNNG